MAGSGSRPTRKKARSFPTIIGCPARLVRTLDEASARDLRDSAAQYGANGRRFAKGLVAIG
jgi:carbonic anhydrase/acetyltransferase-like protein (isoleucine patch superfamily)